MKSLWSSWLDNIAWFSKNVCGKQDGPIVFQQVVYCPVSTDSLHPATVFFNNDLEPCWIEIVASDMKFNLLVELQRLVDVIDDDDYEKLSTMIFIVDASYNI